MNNNFVQPFIDRLDQKKSAFQSEIERTIRSLKLPKSQNQESQQTTAQRQSHNNGNENIASNNSTNKSSISSGIILAAIVLQILGLVIGDEPIKSLLWIALGLMIWAAWGSIMKMISPKKDRNNASSYSNQRQQETSSQSQSQNIDYSALNNQLYKTIEGMCKNVKDNWSNFLSEEKNALMKKIDELDVPIQTKNKMVSEGISRSLISFPVTEVLAKLGKLGQSKNVSEYEIYLQELQVKYTGIVEEAYKEQKARLKRVGDLESN